MAVEIIRTKQQELNKHEKQVPVQIKCLNREREGNEDLQLPSL